MRVLAHLSDLHFGRVDDQVLAPLRDCLCSIAPHLVVVSGDLTQRARSSQFRAAKIFLDSLPQPQLIVPGNHDVPLHNVLARFFQPLKKYQRYIHADVNPVFQDVEMTVMGLNSARALTIKDGRLNTQQLTQLRARFCAPHAAPIKIVVTHHPFNSIAHAGDEGDTDQVCAAMAAFAECGADVLLSGHLHLTHIAEQQANYLQPNFSPLIVQAGTATSTRGRGEANTFNVLHIERDEIEIRPYVWQDASNIFQAAAPQCFRKLDTGWRAQ